LLERHDEIARSVACHILTRVPEYRTAENLRDGDTALGDGVAWLMDLCCRLLREQRDLDDDEREEIVDATSRWARQGLSSDVVTDGIHWAMEVGRREILRTTDDLPGEVRIVTVDAAINLLLDFEADLKALAAEGFRSADGRGEPRWRLVRELLDPGSFVDPVDATTRLGVGASDAVAVVAIWGDQVELASRAGRRSDLRRGLGLDFDGPVRFDTPAPHEVLLVWRPPREAELLCRLEAALPPGPVCAAVEMVSHVRLVRDAYRFLAGMVGTQPDQIAPSATAALALLPTRLLRSVPHDEAHWVIRRCFGPLMLEEPAEARKIAGTLDAYFREGCRINRAARVLGCCEKTVRSRLDRALDAGIDVDGDRFGLEAALRLLWGHEACFSSVSRDWWET
jgi:hypothetical protein